MSLEFMLKQPYNAIFMTDFCGLSSFQFYSDILLKL